MNLKTLSQSVNLAIVNYISLPLCLLSIPVLSLLSTPLSAQHQLQFNHYSLDQGFYDGIVTAIFQDQYRYLWIGTADGLYRFDGYQFMEYRKNTDDPGALVSNVITAIEQDKQGHLWIATEGGGLSLLNRKENQFIHFRHQAGDPKSIASDFISTLLEDQKGHLWIGTEEKGLSVLIYNEKEAQFYFRDFGSLSQAQDSTIQNEINILFEDSRGNIWVGTNEGLVRVQYDSLEKLDVTFFKHDPENPDATLPDNVINALDEDRQGRIWVGTRRGLSFWDPDSGKFSNYQHDPSDPFSLSNNIIRSLAVEDEENLWVGTNDGLNLFNLTDLRSQRFYHQSQQPNSISADLVMRLFKDDQGNTWAGTWGGALNRISPLSRQFTHFPYIPGNEHSLSSPKVLSITEDARGNIWMATTAGLDRYDRTTQQYTHYKYEASDPLTEAFTEIYRVNRDRKGQLWIGTQRGAFRFNPSTGLIRAFKHRPGVPVSLPKASVWDILEDRFGLIWMGTYGGGIVSWNPTTEEMTIYRHDPLNANSLSDNRVMELYEARNGDLWVGTYEGGLTWVRRNPDGSIAAFERFQHDPEDGSSLSSNVVWSILEGKNGDFWIGTGNGLNHLDLDKRTFKSYKESDGLVNNFVFGLLSGEDERLWLSTNRGLSVFDPVTEVFQNFDIRDGLQQNEFNKGAFWKGDKKGELFFGGVNGLILVSSGSEGQNDYLPKVAFNKMVVYPTDPELKNGRVDYGVGYREEVRLAHNENTLEFEFTALNFINRDKNRYSYRLKGLDNQWIHLGNNNTIRFGGLSPGRYTLEVRAAIREGGWNDQATILGIHIQPPWWSTFTAKVFYILSAFFLLVLVYRFIIDKKLAERESERLREQDAFKSKLYTDITHEFRTPLTVISGMTDLIKGNEKARQLIKRNSQSLLNLVNQMLELRKIESGALIFNNVQADIVRFTRYTLEPFYELAGKRDISIQLFSSNKEIWMDFDPEVMHRIIANLVSNAVKYNKDEGRIDIQLSSAGSNGNPSLLLVVQDTGIGIPKKQQAMIFERFYQVKWKETQVSQGTGVGLALVRDYVEALGGNIHLDSQVGIGTTFQVRLPITRKADILAPIQEVALVEPLVSAAEPTFEIEQEEVPQESIKPDQASVLIVEDNPDVIYYLRSCLSGFYNILVEDNGADGIRTALEEVPDLIISDLMMPRKDGYELVQVLKEDIRTSHIPIILLTAKTDLPSKIKGLEGGVDAYLTKPFNPQELLSQISNLLELRKKLQERYQAEIPAAKAPDQSTQKEDDFILMVQQHVKDNLNDPDFGVKELCQEVGLSRTQMHNKLKALANRSTAIYIRLLRLQEARRLLEESDLNIAEISYQVGFKDPNYFSRTFNQEFGLSPSQFRSENT